MRNRISKLTATLALGVATAVSALPSTAHASIVVYTASLSGANEAPANASTGVGAAIVTFDDVIKLMRLQVTFSGLTGNVTAAHIHCCTAVAGSGTAGVATTLPSFTGFPSGVTFGVVDQTYDMTLAGSYSTSFVNANGGTTATAFAAFLAGADAGKAYFNIHTSTFPGGEIRGFLTSSTTVPEPSTYALMGLGLAALVPAARRRRRTR